VGEALFDFEQSQQKPTEPDIDLTGVANAHRNIVDPNELPTQFIGMPEEGTSTSEREMKTEDMEFPRVTPTRSLKRAKIAQQSIKPTEAYEIVGLAESTGLPLWYVQDNLEKVKQDAWGEGVLDPFTDPTKRLGFSMLAALPPSFHMFGAVKTLAPILSYEAVRSIAGVFQKGGKLEQKWLPPLPFNLERYLEEAPDERTRNAVQALDFIATALASHQVYKAASPIIDRAISQMWWEYQAPRTVILSGETVQEVLDASPEFETALKQHGLDRNTFDAIQRSDDIFDLERAARAEGPEGPREVAHGREVTAREKFAARLQQLGVAPEDLQSFQAFTEANKRTPFGQLYREEVFEVLGITPEEYEAVKAAGIKVEVPALGLLHKTDRPWFAALKKAVGLEPTQKTMGFPVTAEGRLPEGAPTPPAKSPAPPRPLLPPERKKLPSGADMPEPDELGTVRIPIGKTLVRAEADVAWRIAQADAEMRAATGNGLQILSSFRTYEEQLDAWNRLHPLGVPVARPGTSRHERGAAIDVRNWKEAQPYLAKYGLVNPIPRDEVHFQLEDGKTATASLDAVEHMKQALAAVETPGSKDPYNQYNLQGSGAFGKYQFMPDTWKHWSSRYSLSLGGPRAPLAPTADNQEAVTSFKIATLFSQGKTPAQVAKIWNHSDKYVADVMAQHAKIGTSSMKIPLTGDGLSAPAASSGGFIDRMARGDRLTWVTDYAVPYDTRGPSLLEEPGTHEREWYSGGVVEGRMKDKGPGGRETSLNQAPTGMDRYVELGIATPGGRHLDSGAGRYDVGQMVLRDQGVISHPVDPFNRSEPRNREAWDAIREAGGVESAGSPNVLNVIRDYDAAIEHLERTWGPVKPGGKMAVNVYEGDRSGKWDGSQQNRPLKWYESFVRKVVGPDASIEYTHGGKLMVATAPEGKKVEVPEWKQMHTELPGKTIRASGETYVHVDYIGRSKLTPEQQDAAHRALENAPPDYPWTIVKVKGQGENVSLMYSPDFDSAPEPTIRASVRFDAAGNPGKVTTYGEENPTIYHGKHLFVGPDYRGPEWYTQAEKRFSQWQSEGYPRRADMKSREIGRKKSWETIASRLGPELLFDNQQKMRAARLIVQASQTKMALAKAGMQPTYEGAPVSRRWKKDPDLGSVREAYKAFRDIVRDETVNLRGLQVTGPADLAMIAQHWRNPQYEELRYVYIKDNRIVDIEGITIRLPGQTRAFFGTGEEGVQHIRDRLDALGADGVALVHNHPSGDPTPSVADRRLTEQLAVHLGENAVLGHIVINSGKYALIDQFGEVAISDLPVAPGWVDPILMPRDKVPQIRQPEDIAAICKQMIKQRDKPVLIYLSSKLTVQGIQEIKPETLKDVSWVPKKLVDFGSTSVALFLPDGLLMQVGVRGYMPHTLLELVEKGVFADIQIENSTGSITALSRAIAGQPPALTSHFGGLDLVTLQEGTPEAVLFEKQKRLPGAGSGKARAARSRRITPSPGQPMQTIVIGPAKVKEVSHSGLWEAVQKGWMTEEHAGIIDSILAAFPEAYREHFVPVVAGVPSPTGAPYEILKQKMGPLNEDAKHIAVMFQGSDPLDFIHAFGRFTHDRLLTGKGDSKTVKQAHKAHLKAAKELGGRTEDRSEWFADQLARWWIERESPQEPEMTSIFRRVLQAMKDIWDRFRSGAHKVSGSMKTLLDDIITNGRQLKEKYFYSDREIISKYVTGAPPTKDIIKKQGFSGNSKTLISWDPSSLCPKQAAFIEWVLKHIEEKSLSYDILLVPEEISRLYDLAREAGVDVPCSYCYVEQARMKALAYHQEGKPITGVNFSMAKQIFYGVPYVDYVLGLSRKEINAINARGGLRLFSFSDYIRAAHRAELDLLLRHCQQMGLSVKAITKNPDLIKDFGDTGIIINMSIDEEGSGMNWDIAAAFKKQYPNCKVRAVGINLKDVDRLLRLEHAGLENFVDVVTPYHHDNKKEPIPDGYQEMSHKSKGGKALRKYLEEHPEYKDRVCCQAGGKCFDEAHAEQCATNCGNFADNLSIPNMDVWGVGEEQSFFGDEPPIPPDYDQIMATAYDDAFSKVENRYAAREEKLKIRWRREAERVWANDPMPKVIKEVAKRGGINEAGFLEGYAKTTLETLKKTHPRLFSPTGKLSIDTVATEYGFDAPEDFLTAAGQTKSKAGYAEDYVQTKAEEYKADAELRDMEFLEDLISQEIVEIRKVNPTATAKMQNIPDKNIKRIVEINTQQKKISELIAEPEALKILMKRTDQAARKAYNAGQIEKALELKAKQKAQVTYAKEQARIRAEVKGMIKFIEGASKEKNIEKNFRLQLDRILEGYGLISGKPRTFAGVRQAAQAKATASGMVDDLTEEAWGNLPLAKFMAHVEKSGELILNGETIMEMPGFKSYKDLSRAELYDLHQGIKALVRLGQNYGKFLSSIEKKEFDDHISALFVEALTRAQKLNEEMTLSPLGFVTQQKGKVQKALESWQDFMKELIKPVEFFRFMDAYEPLGPWQRALYRPMWRAENLELELKQKVAEHFGDIVERIKWDEIVTVPELENLPFTRNQLVAIVLNSGNDGNRACLINGNGIPEDILDDIPSYLTADELEFVDLFHRAFDTITWPLMEKLHWEITGELLEKVPGKYYTIIGDKRLHWRMEKYQEEENADRFFKDIYQRPKVNTKGAHKRTGYQGPVVLDVLAGLKELHSQIHFVTHKVAVRDALKVLGDGRIRTAVSAVLGESAYRQLVPWVANIAKPDKPPQTKAEAWLNRRKQNVTDFLLLYRLSTLLNQPFAVLNTMADSEIGRENFFRGLRNYWANRTYWDEYIKANSPTVAHRVQLFDKTVADIEREVALSSKHWAAAFPRWARESGYGLIGMMDALATKPTWVAAFLVGMERTGWDEALAVEFADQVTMRTQGGGSPKDTPTIQQGLIGGPVWKATFGMLYTFANSMLGQLWSEWQKYKMDESKFRDFVKAYFYMMVMGGLINYMVNNRDIPGPGRAMRAVLSYQAGGYPFVREFAGVIEGYDVRAPSSIGVFGRQLKNTITAAARGDSMAVLVETLGAAGAYWGFPPDQLIIFLEGILAVSDNKRGPGRLLFRSGGKENDDD